MPRSDPFLPVSPAQVKVLVLPVGPVHRDRFASFLDRLNSEYAVHLGDVTADSRPNRNMFNPLAFPDGVIFYDLTTHVPQPSHLALTPFDLYREPLVILALADGAAIKNVPFGSKRQSAAGRSVEERNIRALYQELEELRDTYTKVLVHRVLIFDYVPSPDAPIPIPDDMTTVPPVAQSKRTTMKTVMADVSSLLLAEMNTLARSFDAMSYIESPGQSSTVFRPHANGGAGSIGSVDDASSIGSSTLNSRRNSQYTLPTHRSSSVGSVMSAADRAQARMSMPAPFRGAPSVSSAGPTPGRPSTPVRSGLSGPATTFDDIGGNSSGSGSNVSSPDRAGSPLDLGDGYRSQSQDRIAVQGFGPGGLNERWRNKGKSRVTIVVASLYLQAGRWTDALKELIEGATVSRSINDHLWHGKALELIVVCLLLLSWAGVEFQVPSVCLPPPEKGSAAQAAAQALEAAAEKASPNQPKWLRNLQQILPDLLDRILGLYSRISAENLPPLPLSEATIRFGNILTALHVADGIIDRRFLNMVVEGKYDDAARALTTSPRLSVTPGRAQITSMVFRAFPPSTTELLTTVDRIIILSGIASVLGRLGYQRKKAMVVHKLMDVLIVGLVEARTRGAADVGIHPAAGLVAQNGVHSGHTNGAAALDLAEGDIESGVEAFLGMLLKTYGVVEFEPSAAAPPTAADGTAAPLPIDDSDAATIARIREQATARLFGMAGNKLNLLRECIRFSEALPDFAGVLKFSSDLLRTAGSGIAPGPRRGDAAPIITKEEQVRLVAKIAKTSKLSRRLGLGDDKAAEYWDEFLLRGVKLEPPAAAALPVPHTKSELPGKGTAAAARTSQDVDPFIHNSFLKPSEKAAVEQILVAQELATFKLTLQNPYDIEVEVESVRVETDGGVDFEAYADSTVLGPYRTQIVKVAGMPKAAGSLRITGAVVRVRGCRERRFPIFAQPWSPERPDKVKSIGTAPFQQQQLQQTPQQDAAAVPVPASPALQLAGGPALAADHVALTVIPPQPMVVVQSTTLPQSSVMVLEGERQVFSVTLQNLSATTPVDFLLFSFQDSTQASVQAALGNRDASPAELYEYELILAKKQALRLRKSGKSGKNGKNARYIAPGETATFDFEILGKPGLTSGAIQVDYAHLGVPAGEVAATFYTRQVSLHLTVTVNASIEVARMDVLPLHGSIPQALWDRCGGGGSDGDKTESTTHDNYCLLLLDLRNAWPSQMRVELGAEDGMVVTKHILPGNTSRVIVPLRRIYLEDPHASIPALNPSRQRQFVVSTGKISPDAERANREAFWYREKILDALRGTWTTTTTSGSALLPTATAENTDADTADTSIGIDAAQHHHRRGSIELRGMRLTSRMIEAIKVDEVGIDVAVEDPDTRRATTVVRVDDFAQLRVRVTNRTAQPLYPTLRLMPALCHRPLNVALDFTRKFAWNGALQQALPLLGARATTEVRLGVTALCRGEFEVTASVEETRLWLPTKDDRDREQHQRQSSHRPRSNTETLLMDSMLGPRERRIWHSRTPCHFVVVDGPAGK